MPRLRRLSKGLACANCYKLRKRCSARRPCARCVTRGVECDYPAPAHRACGVHGEETELQNVRSCLQTWSVCRGRDVVGQGFGRMEHLYLSVFMSYTNVMVPMAPVKFLRGALCAKTSPACTSKEQAVLALLLASIATGASLKRSTHSMSYLSAAKEYLRGCYDVPTYETLCALCAVATASFYTDRRGTFVKYARYAHIVYRELLFMQTLDPMAQYNATVVLEYLRRLVLDEMHFVSGTILSDLQDFINETDDMQSLSLQGKISVVVLCICVVPFGEVPVGYNKSIRQLALEEIVSLESKMRSMMQSGFTYATCFAADTLLARFIHLRETRAVEGIPAAEMLLASRPLILHVAMSTTGSCTVRKEAYELVQLLEKYPVLLTSYRKCSVMHWVLNLLDYVCGEDEVLKRRTQRLRMLTPSSDMVQGLEGDASEEVVQQLEAAFVRAREQLTCASALDPSQTCKTASAVKRHACTPKEVEEERREYEENVLCQHELRELQWLLCTEHT